MVRALHNRKAQTPMNNTPSGISMEVRALQPWNALSPMTVTLLGILTEERLEDYGVGSTDHISIEMK